MVSLCQQTCIYWATAVQGFCFYPNSTSPLHLRITTKFILLKHLPRSNNHSTIFHFIFIIIFIDCPEIWWRNRKWHHCSSINDFYTRDIFSVNHKNLCFDWVVFHAGNLCAIVKDESMVEIKSCNSFRSSGNFDKTFSLIFCHPIYLLRTNHRQFKKQTDYTWPLFNGYFLGFTPCTT